MPNPGIVWPSISCAETTAKPNSTSGPFTIIKQKETNSSDDIWLFHLWYSYSIFVLKVCVTATASAIAQRKASGSRTSGRSSSYYPLNVLFTSFTRLVSSFTPWLCPLLILFSSLTCSLLVLCTSFTRLVLSFTRPLLVLDFVLYSSFYRPFFYPLLAFYSSFTCSLFVPYSSFSRPLFLFYSSFTQPSLVLNSFFWSSFTSPLYFTIVFVLNDGLLFLHLWLQVDWTLCHPFLFLLSSAILSLVLCLSSCFLLHDLF